MAKLLASLVVVVLVGITALALACDLQCNLQDSLGGPSDSPCSSHDSLPSAPKHSLDTTAVVKAVAVLLAPVAPIEQFSSLPVMEPAWAPADSSISAPLPGLIVLRI